MPKCSFAVKPKKDDRDAEINAIIEAWLIRRGMSKQMLAVKIGMPYSTMIQHLRDKEKLRYREIRDIFDALKVPDEEKGKIL